MGLSKEARAFHVVFNDESASIVVEAGREDCGYIYAMLSKNGSGPEIGFPGRVSAGF
jgi:hypothetical protein